MWLKIVFLIISINFVLISAQGSIRCSYRQRTQYYPYTCDLTLINPAGNDNFNHIPGDHLPNRSNEDVEVVNGFNQESTIVPSIICRQFPNLKDLYISSSGITTINEVAFASCNNLEHVMLSLNRITEIPANTFGNNSNLEYISLSYNEIHTISPNAFTGAGVRYLDLGVNELRTYNPAWFTPISATLDTLQLLSNRFTSLPSRPFSNIPNLVYLELTGNEFTSIPADTFSGLTRLETLYLTQIGISDINRQWFTELTSLDEFHFEMNNLRSLPNGIFTQLVRLRRIYLGVNNLTTIGLGHFGRNIAQMEVISIDNNPIISIERGLIEHATHLLTLGLHGGVCFGTNLYNFPNNRDRAMELLARCFASFGPELARCSYGFNDNDEYGCGLDIRNPQGTEFAAIEGAHEAGNGNNDVITVTAMERSTRTIPGVLCRQFSRLRDLTITASFVDVLTPDAFENCRNLQLLSLQFNELTGINDETFVGMSQLSQLQLRGNRIFEITRLMFSGTSLTILDLSQNRIRAFVNGWDNAIASTLVDLDLSINQIQQINADTFSNLRNLRTLRLNENFIYQLDDDSFVNLASLNTLELSGCGFTELNPNWFRSLSNLNHLSIGNNRLTNFQPNLFNSLTRINSIYFFNNRISELRADSFGASLPSLRILYGSNNVLNVFDPEILVRAPELTSILFYNNLCIRENLFDVRGETELVQRALSNCTNNFELERTLSCDYERMITGRIYWCQLTAVNPTGIDTFARVEGNHLAGANDDSVMFVSIQDQNTRVIPSIICRQFRNLQILDSIRNQVDEIRDETFRNCGFLRELMIFGSNIVRIPNNAFSGARNLRVLFLDVNGIEFIGETAFQGTQIEHLDLTNNEIHEFNPRTFGAIGSTLRVLRLTENRLESLPPNAFNMLTGLVDLELNHNHFFTLPSGVFDPLVNLEILQLANCGLEQLQPGLFSRLRNLRDLELGLNDLDFLPENIFDLPNLRLLGLVQNNFRTLDAAAFGRSLQSLQFVDASINRIDSFDPEIISANSSITDLELAWNNCIDQNFIDIPQFRDQVLRNLQNCVNNFNEVTVRCEFSDEGETIYQCRLILDNTNDRLRFESVEAVHSGNRNDDAVTHIRAVDQNSRTIPSIICEQFRFVEAFYFISSNVQFISAEAFRGCENMFSINLSGNRLTEIPDRTFAGNPYLAALTLAVNRIQILRPGAFSGTSIYYLDIEENLIRNFDPEWLSQIASGIRYLILRNNNIQRLPPRAFTRFRNLYQLELSGNKEIFIPSNAFERLTNLGDLEIADCNLRHLNPHWFRDLVNLYRLEVDMNEIDVLAHRTFDLPSLQTLGIAFNNIEVLHSRVFGSSLNSVVSIDATENRINAIDRRIFTEGRELAIFSLIGNTCADADFQDIHDNREEIMENLEGCFTNFENMV